ncbi:MAG: hypothetical protein AVDCRST_MAG59-4399, partial [uncultured Thermomicrobiales bacterium]
MTYRTEPGDASPGRGRGIHGPTVGGLIVVPRREGGAPPAVGRPAREAAAQPSFCRRRGRPALAADRSWTLPALIATEPRRRTALRAETAAVAFRPEAAAVAFG